VSAKAYPALHPETGTPKWGADADAVSKRFLERVAKDLGPECGAAS
jgi:hypothetical protein